MTVKAALAGAAMMFAAASGAAEAANAITSATVNFRASPGGAVLGAIPNGAPVTVLGRSGNWCQTEWYGQIGWVYCRYVHAAVVQAPRPYYPSYGYDPYFYGPTIGFGLGFGIDRHFHPRHRFHRFGGRDFGHGGHGFGRGGGRGEGGGGTGSRSEAAELRNR
ncbi:MAG TPA: SH3 domain-containing protein [Afifellaceae bacterium]|nr:SH3 domain-containing protein [Afifellaceae bacterium]